LGKRGQAKKEGNKKAEKSVHNIKFFMKEGYDSYFEKTYPSTNT
jgi:hypothetical protein